MAKKDDGGHNRLTEAVTPQQSQRQPRWAGQAPFVGLAILEVGVALAGIACEITQLYSDIHGLVLRQVAADAGFLTAYDATHWGAPGCMRFVIPGTSLSSQPGGNVAGAFWRIANCVALFFIVWSAAPGRKHLEGTWTEWNGPFGLQQGCWYEGAVMFLIGSSIVGTPTTIVGPEIYHSARYIIGWALLGFGAVTFLVGFAFGKTVRWRRGQTRKPLPKDPTPPKERIERELAGFIQDLKEVYVIRLPTSEVEKYLQDMRDALKMI